MNMFRGRIGRLLMVVLLVAISVGLMGMRPRPAAPKTSTPATSPAPAMPEPGGFVLFAVGAGIVGFALHRRSRRS